MADKIVQTGIGLPVETLARLDRLRACIGRSRSFVVDYVLSNGGLEAVEEDLATDIAAYEDLAGRLGVGWQQLAERYVEEFGAKTYPPTVAMLCDMWGSPPTGRQALQEASAPARSLRDLRSMS